MKRRTVWAWSSLVTLVVLAAVLASCGGAPGTTPPTGTTTPPTSTSPTPTTAAVTQPTHGGQLVQVWTTDPTVFDPAVTATGGSILCDYVYESLLTSDWLRGPAGTNVTDYASGANFVEDYYGLGGLAESWEMPSLGVWKLKIRQGVHWQQTGTAAGSLMAGRELTADDVVYNFNRLKSDNRSWGMVSQPKMMNPATIEKTGPWEVTIKTPVDPWTAFVWLIYSAGFYRVFPTEVCKKYGDVADWHNAVGTGPFILKDFVPGSSMTFVKNPNYWDTDPAGPGKGNKVPYVDSLKSLIVVDPSVRQAALRAGKIDFLADITLTDAEAVIATNPELKYRTYLSGQPWVFGMRRDPGTPLGDVRVRQALMLATDYDAFVKGPFRGNAEIDVYPVAKNVGSLYQPLSEMPAAVQDLFKYQPDKAKKLLADAGYPNLKLKVLAPSTTSTIDDILVFQQMWSKVGVELVIDQREFTAYYALAMGRKQEQMVFRSMFQTFSIQLFLSGLRGTSTFNYSFVDDPAGSDPFVEERYNTISTSLFVDNEKAYKAYRELKPYLLEQVFYIPRPTPYSYVFWQPWLKNYEGQGGAFFCKYYWIDTKLKKEMGK